MGWGAARFLDGCPLCGLHVHLVPGLATWSGEQQRSGDRMPKAVAFMGIGGNFL